MMVQTKITQSRKKKQDNKSNQLWHTHTPNYIESNVIIVRYERKSWTRDKLGVH